MIVFKAFQLILILFGAWFASNFFGVKPVIRDPLLLLTGTGILIFFGNQHQHKHKWKEIARMYAPSTVVKNLRTDNDRTMEKVLFGVTTIVFKCSDESCGELKKIESLGKEASGEVSEKKQQTEW